MAYAAVLCHDPATERTTCAPFRGDDPCHPAERFMRDAIRRGDFPGAMWTIVCDHDAARARKRRRIAAVLGEDAARQQVP